MEKIIATVSKFASTDEYIDLSRKVDAIDSHVHQVEHSLATFTSDHYLYHEEEKTKYKEELNKIQRSSHTLKIALMWTLGGLICSGIAILALCVHIIS